MMRLRILHISDLHERAAIEDMPDERRSLLAWDAEERSIVLGERFLAAVRDVARDGIDLVCCTGDVADWGRPEEYLAAKPRITAILDAAGVPPSRFFAVPGNHDVDRRIHEDAWHAVRNYLVRTGDHAAIGRWFRDIGAAPPGLAAVSRRQLLARTEAFWDWMDSLGRGDLRPKAPRWLGYRYTFPVGTFPRVELPLHIVGLDSAWSCGGGDDQGRIAVTEEQIQGHTHGLEGFVLALVHHPLDHLADHHQARRALSHYGVGLVLHGHQHTPLALQLSEPGASLRVLASGCLMEGELGKNWPNEFQLVEIDPPSTLGAVHFRKWARDARSWATGTDIYPSAPHGTLTWGTLADQLRALLERGDVMEVSRLLVERPRIVRAAVAGSIDTVVRKGAKPTEVYIQRFLHTAMNTEVVLMHLSGIASVDRRTLHETATALQTSLSVITVRSAARGVVVAGRRGMINRDDHQAFSRRWRQERIELHSYDWLVDVAETL